MQRTTIYSIFLFLLFAFLAIGEFFDSVAQKGCSSHQAVFHPQQDSLRPNYNQCASLEEWRHLFVKQTFTTFVDNSYSPNTRLCEEKAKLKMSILGDSYSTYKGYVSPDTNEYWYADTMDYKNNLHDVKQTWWWIVQEDMGWKLEKNNSFSGATVCNTGYNGRDFSKRSFVTRMANIGEPDILFIFGGTNDCWAHSPLGDFIYEDWKATDLYKFRAAFAFMINYLTRKHPKMRIINICNSNLKGEYCISMEKICRYYKIENIQLKDIDKQHSHPSILGMREIAAQIEKLVKQENNKEINR